MLASGHGTVREIEQADRLNQAFQDWRNCPSGPLSDQLNDYLQHLLKNMGRSVQMSVKAAAVRGQDSGVKEDDARRYFDLKPRIRTATVEITAPTSQNRSPELSLEVHGGILTVLGSDKSVVAFFDSTEVLNLQRVTPRRQSAGGV